MSFSVAQQIYCMLQTGWYGADINDSQSFWNSLLEAALTVLDTGTFLENISLQQELLKWLIKNFTLINYNATLS